MRRWVALQFLCCAHAAASDVYYDGHSSCPCLEVSESHSIVSSGGTVQWTEDYMYGDANYGLQYGLRCMSHDNFKPPSCDNATSKPSWCADPWCYVDPDVCTLKATMSSYRPGVRLAYSYNTCSQGVADGLARTGAKNFAYLLAIALGPALLVLVLVFGQSILMRCTAASTSAKAEGGAGAADADGESTTATTAAAPAAAEDGGTEQQISTVSARLELAVKADRQLTVRVTSLTISIA